jgi:hypothetical protein
MHVTLRALFFLSYNTKQVIHKVAFVCRVRMTSIHPPSVWLCDENTLTVHGAGRRGYFNVHKSFSNSEWTALRMSAAGQAIDSCKLPVYLYSCLRVSHSILIMKERLKIPRLLTVSLHQSILVVHS